jgi:hypothetical protein
MDNKNIIETKYGKIEVRPVDIDYMVVTNAENEPIVINRVEVNFTMRLGLYTDSKGTPVWDLERDSVTQRRNYHSLYTSRPWQGTKQPEVSFATREKIEKEIKEIVVKWVDNNYEKMLEAQLRRLKDEINNAGSKVYDARLALDEAEKCWSNAKAALKEFEKKFPNVQINKER